MTSGLPSGASLLSSIGTLLQDESVWQMFQSVELPGANGKISGIGGRKFFEDAALSANRERFQARSSRQRMRAEQELELVGAS
jgi:hypothetical protein